MITEGSSGSQPQHTSTPPRCGTVARNASMRTRTAPVMRATGDTADTVFDRDHCARPPTQ